MAPELWRSELLNVVAGEMRRRGMSLAGAMDVMADADRCILADYQPGVQQVLRLAASSRCTAYDLQFVALAQQLQAPLVTMDHQLLRTFPDIARPLVPR